MDQAAKLIAWVGGQFFMPHMSEHGFRTLRIPLAKPEALTYADIVERCGQEPDAVVYTDRSLPPPLLGVERFPCLTAFYCIDSHIHGWYPLYAGAFDLCAVSLRDHVEGFAAQLSPQRAVWLPAYAEERYLPKNAEKVFDLLFVGTVDPETTPLRCDFLERLRAHIPSLAVRRGDFGELMPQARVVLNIAERGDLNFRVFESLACGSCLLTPRIPNGQEELFADGMHLTLYEPDDAQDCAAKARALLENGPLRVRLAAQGLAEVDAKHRERHRAAFFADLLRRGFEAALPAARLAVPDENRRKALRLLFLHWAEHSGDTALSARYLAEARTLAARVR